MKLLSVFLLAGTTLAFPAPQQGQRNGTCNAEMTAMLLGGIQANLDIQKQELMGWGASAHDF